MVHIHGSIDIDRPVEEVFEALVDLRNEPSYNPAMRECRLLTAEPIGVGSRFASTMGNRGRPVRMVSEITRIDPDRYLGTRTTGAGTVVTGGLTLDRSGPDATRMSWDWQLRPTGAMRLLTPLLVVLGGRMERRIWTGLKEWMERGRTSG
jgi:uncharacterized protein YndB with AHSA1/START domain